MAPLNRCSVVFPNKTGSKTNKEKNCFVNSRSKKTQKRIIACLPILFIHSFTFRGQHFVYKMVKIDNGGCGYLNLFGILSFVARCVTRVQSCSKRVFISLAATWPISIEMWACLFCCKRYIFGDNSPPISHKSFEKDKSTFFTVQHIIENHWLMSFPISHDTEAAPFWRVGPPCNRHDVAFEMWRSQISINVDTTNDSNINWWSSSRVLLFPGVPPQSKSNLFIRPLNHKKARVSTGPRVHS